MQCKIHEHKARCSHAGHTRHTNMKPVAHTFKIIATACTCDTQTYIPYNHSYTQTDIKTFTYSHCLSVIHTNLSLECFFLYNFNHFKRVCQKFPNINKKFKHWSSVINKQRWLTVHQDSAVEESDLS